MRDKSIIILVEPSFHGLQYIDLLKEKEYDFIALRRSGGPIASDEIEYLIIDFNDIEGAYCIVKEWLNQRGYTKIGIIPGNDFCVPIVSELNEHLGLKTNSSEAAWGARNKIQMRKLLRKAHVHCPDFQYFYNIDEIKNVKDGFSYPLIVKPSDMCNSKLVKLVNNYAQLLESATEILLIEENFLNYQKEIAVLVEEYAIGEEFSVELLLEDSDILFASVTEKHKTDLPYFVEMGHVVPSSITTDEENASLIQASLMAARAIGLTQGPIHAEVVLTAAGPSIIELAGRVGGDNIMHLVKYATGVYLPELVVEQLLGKTLHIERKLDGGAAIRFISGKPGKIKSIDGWENSLAMPKIIGGKLDVSVGDVISPLTSSGDRIGYIMAVGKDGKNAYSAALEAVDNININIES